MPSNEQTLETPGSPPIHHRTSKLLFWAERVVLLTVLATFAVKGFVPGWRHLNSDFPNYYVIARLYRAGYQLERVYEWTWLQRQRDHQGIDQGLAGFTPSTLLSALPIIPWSALPPLEAKRCWLILNLAFLVAEIFLLSRITQLGLERVALLMFLAILPLSHNFLLGQMHVAVLLLVTLAMWLFFRGSHVLSGVSLAVAAALKIYPALFLIYLVWKRQWRAVLGLVVGLGGAAMLSLLLFGRAASLLYVRTVLPAGLRGETLDPYSPAWNSWTALIRRLFIAEPELNPVPVAHLPWLYALLQPFVHGLIFVVFMWAIGTKKRDMMAAKFEWATFLFLLLFLSSQPSSYHLVALILTAAVVVDYLLSQNKMTAAGFAIAIYLLISAPVIRLPNIVPAGWQNLLFFSRLAWMTAFGGLLLWILLPHSRQSLKAHFNLKATATAISALMVIVAIGFISTQKHLKLQFENYAHRVGTAPDELLAANPAPTSLGILFTRMTLGRYVVSRLQDDLTVDLSPADGDWFHPAALPEADSVWSEHSMSKGSSIVRLAIDPPKQNSFLQIDAENAEEPVVSPDGKFLAFLRPHKGRGSLWIRTMGETSSTIGEGAMREIAGEKYDVREANFLPDGRLVFSGRRDATFRLYIATQAGRIDELSKPSCSARYPAISPDGKWMVFGCEQSGTWQLHVTDLEGNRDLQLTFGDCNSISPVWTADSKTVIYATDCGRGLGLTALAEIAVF